MAIAVRKLFKNATILYQMKLIAGKEGLDHLVQWVHIIEDEDVSKFLHGQELIFTAGILNTGEEWFLNFARKLHAVGTTAFVINIGPHTKEVPKSVIEFCDKVQMPLFTIPWQTRMVDMTRDFCHRIMKNDDIEMSVSTTIKNIIFGIGDLETQISHMERYGYQREGRFSFVTISVDASSKEESEVRLERLKRYAESIARSIHELYVAFSYNGDLTLALVNYSIYEVENFIEKYLSITEKEVPKWQFYIGVSSNTNNIRNQQCNFNRALEALRMAKKQHKQVVYYDKLGVYKLLLSVDDKEVLRDFYKESVGKIEAFDKENQTDLMSFLKIYLENNGSPQLVSEKQYVHRNTVTNQLKRIAKITGFDPMDLEDRVKLYLGFYINDIL